MAKKKEEKQGIDLVLANLEKKYGQEKLVPEDLVIVSTGSLQLNQAMGVGGTAVGKFIEIFGENSSGKSTLTLHQMAEYQQKFPERKVALFDYEYAFDKKYARALGVDVDGLLIYQPTTQEEGYDMALALIENNIISCLVIDSQSAAMPKAILQGEMGDATIGLQARLNSKFCMKVKGLLANHNCTLFVISQTRSNIGGYGEASTTTGGNAIKFYADVRWKVWKQNDKENELNKTTVDVIKNKLGNPFGVAKFAINWGTGIDKLREIIEYAVEFDLLKKGGAGWFTLEDGSKLQGMDTVKNYLEENYEELLILETKIINKLNGIEEHVKLINENIEEFDNQLNNLENE
jgi:recombination protein RecA